LNKIKDDRPWIKEGYIGMFLFFPNLLGDKFGKYLSVSLDNLQQTLSYKDSSIEKLSIKVIRILI
jgi:hypothetical protein